MLGTIRFRLVTCALAGAAAFATLLDSGDARAEAEGVEWNPEWPRFRKAEIAFTAGMGLQFLAANFLYPQLSATSGGPILYDTAARNALVLSSRSSRERAQLIGDVLFYGLVAYPLLVDTTIVLAVHDSSDVALQMTAMNLESIFFVGAIARSAEKLGRVRPSSSECEKDPGYSADCEDDDVLSASMLSGHTAGAFAGAGLICAHHTNLPLYGGGAPDIAACILGLGAAGSVATLRLMSDDHWATDVTFGAALGLFGGWGLPVLLHYGFGDDSPPARSILPTFRAGSGPLAPTAVLAPTVGRSSFGVTMVGSF
jgi:hypothetical protein